MIDDLLVEIDIVPPKEVEIEIREPFDYYDLIFSPLFRSGRVIKYYANWKNLRLEICYNKLSIKNSWHKFYHGNNYGNYTFSDIKYTIEIFVNKFGKEILNARIKNMTIGCNLSLTPTDYYTKCASLGPKFFQEMRYGNIHKVYGHYVKETNKKFKIYDKQVEVKYHDRLTIQPTLRVELEMKMRYFQKRSKIPIRVYTLADLNQNEWISQIKNELANTIQRIVFNTDLPIEEDDSFTDFQIKRLMCNPINRRFVKLKSTPKTYQKWAKLYDEFIYKHQDVNLKENLVSLVDEKMKFLENN